MKYTPALTMFLMLGPVAAGFLGTFLPSFGYMPTLGEYEFGLTVYKSLLEWPGMTRAVGLSVATGFAATLLSLGAVMLIVAGWHGTRAFTVLERGLSPLLSVPHAAAAFGLAFLIAPSGWIARLLSPWMTAWDRPPDILILQDPWGASLVAGLVAKEIPFLLLMTLAALPQARSTQSMLVAKSLGYHPVSGWFRTVFPSVYRQIRLPVYAVLAFSMSVVDVAIILGPNTPPPLSVQIVKWMNDPDLTLRLRAMAGACLQLLLVLCALVVWRVAELVTAYLGRIWIEGGHRGHRHADALLRFLGFSAAAVSAIAILGGLVGMATWSVAGFWHFPDALPQGMTLRSWTRHGSAITDPLVETLLIGAVATLIAISMTIACLETEHRQGRQARTGSLWLLYLPLIVPQVAFLGGVQTFSLLTGLDGGRLAVILAHLVFVLPYVFLSLSDPWRAWDTRMDTAARALGASRGRVLWTVRLPMLLRPVLTAAAVGFAVSVGQYLPTLMVGAGRVQTLTTEAIALASGGDRRVLGIYALVQTTVALAPFALAYALPRFLWSNRRGMSHA